MAETVGAIATVGIVAAAWLILFVVKRERDR